MIIQKPLTKLLCFGMVLLASLNLAEAQPKKQPAQTETSATQSKIDKAEELGQFRIREEAPEGFKPSDISDSESLYTAADTYNGTLLPSGYHEYTIGNADESDVHLFVYSDPTKPVTRTIVQAQWPEFKKLVDEKGIYVNYRPIATTPLAGTVSVLMSCFGDPGGIRFLRSVFMADPIWDTQPYGEIMNLLKKTALKEGMTETAFDECLNDAASVRNLHYRQQDDLFYVPFSEYTFEDADYFLNGTRWGSAELWPLIKKDIDNTIHFKSDLGEDHPAFNVRPDDRVLGNPNAPIKVFDFGHIANLRYRPMLGDGVNQFLLNAAKSGRIAYVYRPFYFHEASKEDEVIARCVPKPRFFDFVHYINTNKDFWGKREDPTSYFKRAAKLFGASEACFKSTEVHKKVETLRDEALNELNITLVSTYVYRGMRWYGDLTFKQLESLIRAVNSYRQKNRGNQ